MRTLAHQRCTGDARTGGKAVTSVAPSEPQFRVPRPFVIPPAADSGVPFYSHNHCPAITWLSNGDLLACWFSTIREAGTEMTILSSRLRAGLEAWDAATAFFKVPNCNMTGSSLFYDEQTGVLHHLNGMGREGAEWWAEMVLVHRTSRDNGVTWTEAHPVSAGARYQRRNTPIAGMVRTRDGCLVQLCDATELGTGNTAVHVSRDGGLTWQDTGGDIRGIHAGMVELKDGRWLAFGRGNALEGRMPQSLSEDQGRTWQYTASAFPAIGSAQRLVLLRLREGPLVLVSYTGPRDDTKEMRFNDHKGRGMFAAVSDDEGQTWPVRKLLTPGEGIFEVGPYFGAKVKRPPYVKTTPTEAEREGYLAATQSPDGLIHLVSSRLYYRFNLAWLTA